MSKSVICKKCGSSDIGLIRRHYNVPIWIVFVLMALTLTFMITDFIVNNLVAGYGGLAIGLALGLLYLFIIIILLKRGTIAAKCKDCGHIWNGM